MNASFELSAGPFGELRIGSGQLRAVDHCIAREDRIHVLPGQPGIVKRASLTALAVIS